MRSAKVKTNNARSRCSSLQSRAKAVSYTHLDVYKRQLPHSGMDDFIQFTSLNFSTFNQRAASSYGLTFDPLPSQQNTSLVHFEPLRFFE